MKSELRLIAALLALIGGPAFAAVETIWSTPIVDSGDAMVVDAPTCMVTLGNGDVVFASDKLNPALNSISGTLLAMRPDGTVRWSVGSSLPGTPVACARGEFGGIVVVSRIPAFSRRYVSLVSDAGVVSWSLETQTLPGVKIHTDSLGNIYLSDEERVYTKVSMAGALIYSVTLPPGIIRTTVDRVRNRLVMISSDRHYYVIDDSGIRQQLYSLFPPFVETAGSAISSIRGIAAYDGNVYVAGRVSDAANVPQFALIGFSASGQVLFQVPIGDKSVHLAVDSSGNLTVLSGSAEQSTWLRLNATGSQIAQVTAPLMAPVSPSAMNAMWPDGEIASINALPQPTIRRISNAGVFVESAALLSTPNRLVGRSNLGYVSHRTSGTAQIFSGQLNFLLQTNQVQGQVNTLLGGSEVNNGVFVATSTSDHHSVGPTGLAVRVPALQPSAFEPLRRVTGSGRIVTSKTNPPSLVVLTSELQPDFEVPTPNLAIMGEPRIIVNATASTMADGRDALGVITQVSNDDNQVSTKCRLVLLGPTLVTSSVFEEPLETAGDLGCRVLGANDETAFVISNQQLRARSATGQLRWQVPLVFDRGGPILRSTRFVLSGDQMFFLSQPSQPAPVSIQARDTALGSLRWLSSLPSHDLIGPIRLGPARVAVVARFASETMVHHYRADGSDPQTVTLPGLAVSFASELGDQIVLGGVFGPIANPDARFVKIGQDGSVIEDDSLQTPGADRVLAGSALPDGSWIVASDQTTDNDTIAQVRRMQFARRVSQAEITSVVPNSVEFMEPVVVSARADGIAPSGMIRIEGRQGQVCSFSAPSGSCVIAPSTAGLYRFTARYDGDANNLPSSSEPVFVTVNSTSDFSASVTSAPASLGPNNVFVYEFTIANLGSPRTAGMLIRSNLPSGVTLLTWTCTATPSAFCVGPTSGAGPIDGSAVISGGQSVSYRVVAQASASAPEVIQISASVDPPQGVTDSNPTNNTSTVTAIKPLFANSFE